MMAPMAPGEWERLLNGLLDGTLDAAEQARLTGILRADGEARKRYLRWQSLHAALMWDYAATASGQHREARPRTEPRWWSRHRVLAAAAALMMAATLALWWQWPAHVQHRVLVTTVHGVVTWSRGDGSAPEQLSDGERIGAGTLVCESDMAYLSLRFDDGSRLTMTGDSELTVSDRGAKVLELRHGALSAQVEPQAHGQPMRIATRAAQIEVIGTQFSIVAESTETVLNVDKGRVLLRRLVDGRTVEVGAQQGVVASLALTDLAPVTTPIPPLHWHRSLATPLPPTCTGRWMPAEDGLPARAHAQPFVAGRKANGTIVTHYGVGIRAATGEPRCYVTVSADSVLRFRYRVARATSLKCFLSCQRPDGAFVGNFELSWPGSPITATSAGGGWQDAELPLAAAQPRMANTTVTGGQVATLIIHSYEDDAGLEIADVDIAPAPDRK